MEYNLDRFVLAQERDFYKALLEIKNGSKCSHWMWYIFPQLKGLGHSAMSEFYGISDIDEAKKYLENDYLRGNLLRICNALLYSDNSDVDKIFEYPDNLKLKSSMTLFDYVSEEGNIYSQILDSFFNGERDVITMDLIYEYENKLVGGIDG